MTLYSNKNVKTPIISTPPPQPGFFTKNIINPVKEAFNSGVEQTKQGFQDAKTAGFNPVKSFEATLKTGSGIATALTSPLAPILNPTVGAGTQALGNKIAENPTVQKFANSPAGQTTSRIAEDVGNAANIAGTVVGGAQIADAIHPIFNRATPILDPVTVTGAQEQLSTANQNYVQADVGVAKATNTANEAVQADVGKGGALGKEYAAKIENIPGESNLSNSQLQSLQSLKEGKNYQTPDFVEKANATKATMDGRDLSNPENLKVKAQIDKLTGQTADQTGLKVNSKQAGEIMRGLNETTYKVADGQKVIDQSRIGITKNLEQQFAKDFGSDWVAAHSEFKAGVKFRDTLDGIVNFDKNAPPGDLIKQTDALQKQLQTPGGEYQIRKVIDEYASVRGEDKASVLEDLIAKTKEVGKQQEILKIAQTNVAEAIKMAEKGGYGKQFITALKNPSLAARRLIGPVVAIPATIILLPYLRKLYKSLTGQ